MREFQPHRNRDRQESKRERKSEILFLLQRSGSRILPVILARVLDAGTLCVVRLGFLALVLLG